VQVPEQMSDVVVLASVTHKTRRCIEHGLEAIQQGDREGGPQLSETTLSTASRPCPRPTQGPAARLKDVSAILPFT